MRGCRRSEAGRRCRDSAQPISSRALSTRPHAPSIARRSFATHRGPDGGYGTAPRWCSLLTQAVLRPGRLARRCPAISAGRSRVERPHRLTLSPRHRFIPIFLAPFGPLPPPHPPTPPFLLSPSGRRASAFLGPGAGLPARRRCGGAGSLRVSPPEPRARLLSFSSTCLQSRLSVERYAGSKIFQRNVIVLLHEQHISLRRILIVLQLRATSLILAL